MATYWAIAIGINQYQHYQPLIYAQRDAQVFRDFLIQEAGLSPQQCFLLTDAVAINQAALYPSRDSIQTCITQVCQQLQPEDTLWCFFSGYGVRIDAQEYLLPIEGDPTQLATTAIPIEFLFQQFQAAQTQNILLVLDVNRSQSVLAGEGIGDQTAALANQYGVATLLSCPPTQFSHETLALRQGLFTAALIQGIRDQGCVTLDQLVQYLSHRLPELSEHHWRPRQEPFAILPAEKRHRLIVPEQAAIGFGSVRKAIEAKVTQMEPVETAPAFGPDYRATAPSSTAVLERSFDLPSVAASFAGPAAGNRQVRESQAGIAIQAIEPASAPAAQMDSPAFFEDVLWRQRFLRWGGILAALLLLGVILRNAGALISKSGTDAQAPPAPSPAASPAQKTPAAPVAAPPEAKSPVPEPSPLQIQVEPGSPMEAALLAVQSQQYEEAVRRLEQIPADQRGDDFQKLSEVANRGLLGEARGMLIRTRGLTAENQASDFVEAIKKARQIKPGQPLYDAAQQDITRWSQIIFDMSQGRANRPNGEDTLLAAENYSYSIRTARFVPDDRGDLYTHAQQAIAQWSQRILDLANARAAEGNYDLAIQAAEFVPPDTAVYGAAQEAIANWRNQPTP